MKKPRVYLACVVLLLVVQCELAGRRNNRAQSLLHRHASIRCALATRGSLCVRVVKENANEAVVEDGFRTSVGGLGLLRRSERHDGGVRLALVAHLQVGDKSELGEVFVDAANIVFVERHFAQFK